VALHVGGAYAFWGKNTGWVETERDADQRITAIDPGRMLVFRWSWVGLVNDVRFTLADVGGQTSMTVVHSADREHPVYENDTAALFMDFWDTAAANLDGFVRTGRPVLLPDKSAREGGLVLEIEVDAPPERVFAALTDPEKMNRWLAKAAVVDARAGGAYSYGWTRSPTNAEAVGPTRIVEIVPNRLVVHDWHYANEPKTTVRWELTPLADGRTRITLRHDVPGDTTFGAYVGGWTKFLLALRSFLGQ
jgi:uncharacterized protein YndB with AHSA1/START domain